MPTMDTELEAFLEYEVDWHMHYAELCRTVSASMPSPQRGKDWHSRADASIRRAQACLERLGTLRNEQRLNPLKSKPACAGLD